MKGLRCVSLLLVLALAIMMGIQGGLGYAFDQYQQEEQVEENMSTTIAVVNQDLGVVLEEQSHNYSTAVIDTLDQNCVLVSAQAAETGYYDGTYGAVIVFPSDVSQKIATVETLYPEQVVIDYRVNPELPEEKYIATYKQILEVEHQVSRTFSFLYVSTLYQELHRAQDTTAALLENDEVDIAALQRLERTDFTQYVSFSQMPEVRLDLQEANVEDPMETISESSEKISEAFLSSYRNAQGDYNTTRRNIAELAGKLGFTRVEKKNENPAEEDPSEEKPAEEDGDSSEGDETGNESGGSSSDQTGNDSSNNQGGNASSGDQTGNTTEGSGTGGQTAPDTENGNGSQQPGADGTEQQPTDEEGDAAKPVTPEEGDAPTPGEGDAPTPGEGDATTPGEGEGTEPEEPTPEPEPIQPGDLPITPQQMEYILSDEEALSKLSDDELTKVLISLLNLTERYVPATYLSNETVRQANTETNAIFRAIQEANQSFLQAQSNNTTELNEAYRGYSEYVSTMHSEAVEANQQAQENLDAGLQQFYRVKRDTSEENQNLIGRFSGILPYSKLNEALNPNVVQFTADPVEYADIETRTQQEADYTQIVSARSNLNYGMVACLIALLLCLVAWVIMEIRKRRVRFNPNDD